MSFITKINSLIRPNKVKDQVDQNKLVVGYGESAGNLSKYWLFDGYKFYRDDVYYRVYDPMGSGTYTDTLESSTTYNLCHCNFGYSCNHQQHRSIHI